MKALVVAEFYPRSDDPVLGVWAHRQAQAAMEAGAEVRVAVLHRIVPPKSTPILKRLPAAARLARHPSTLELDGVTVDYVRYASPPKESSYGSWGSWAAKPLAKALRRIGEEFPFEVVHAHNAVPAADALLAAGISRPLVISEHGADVFHTAERHEDGRRAIRHAFASARLVLANSSGIANSCEDLGAQRVRVLHLGTDLPEREEAREARTTIVTVAHLAARKRHADVIRALWALRDERPDLRYLVIGDGPERPGLEALAASLGLADRVEFAGQLPHDEALERMRRCSLFVMPSVDEAFGVAYVEAMAGWLPAIGTAGEPGPMEIARSGEGIRLVPPGDVLRLAEEIGALTGDLEVLSGLGAQARRTVEDSFSWERCGEATVAAYREVRRP